MGSINLIFSSSWNASFYYCAQVIQAKLKNLPLLIKKENKASAITTKIRAIDRLNLDLPQHKDLLITSLKVDLFSPVESELIRLLRTLEASQYGKLDQITALILKEDACEKLIERWHALVERLSFWEDFFKSSEENFKTHEFAKFVQTTFQNQYAATTDYPSQTFVKKFKKSLLNFLKIVVYCANLVNLGKEPTNFIEAKTMLDVWHSFYLIPLAIFTALAFFLPSIVSLGITVALLATLITSSYLYHRYASPLPETLPYCELIKPDQAVSIIGREREQAQIEKAILHQSDSVYRCPLIVGKPGIGKSSFARSLAHKFPEKKVFYCNVSSLISAHMNAAFSLISPLEQVKRKVAHSGKDVIIILDEIHEAFEPHNKNFGQQLAAMIYNPSKEGRAHCLGITTLEFYKKTLDNFAKQQTTLSLGDRRFEIFSLAPTDSASTLSILKQRCADLSILAGQDLLIKITELQDANGFFSHPDLALSIIENAYKKLLSLQSGESYLEELANLQKKKSEIPSSLVHLQENFIQIHEIITEENRIQEKIKQEQRPYQHLAKQKAILQKLHQTCYLSALQISKTEQGSMKNRFLATLKLGQYLEGKVKEALETLPYLRLTNEILEQVIAEKNLKSAIAPASQASPTADL